MALVKQQGYTSKQVYPGSIAFVKSARPSPAQRDIVFPTSHFRARHLLSIINWEGLYFRHDIFQLILPTTYTVI